MTPPDWINRETALLSALGIGLLLHCIHLWHVSRSDPLIKRHDLYTGDNGRLASSKVYHYGAFILSGWAMVWFTVTGHADQVGWAAWTAIWVSGAIGNKMVNNAAVAKAQENATAAGQPAPSAAQVIGKSE